MKKFLPIVMLLMTGAAFAPAKADLVHRLTTSTQLSVDAAATTSTRIGSTYSVSGNNIKVATDNHFGKLTAGTATAAATLDVGAYEMNTSGSAFSFTESWTQGDAVNAIGAGVDVTSGAAGVSSSLGNSNPICCRYSIAPDALNNNSLFPAAAAFNSLISDIKPSLCDKRFFK